MLEINQSTNHFHGVMVNMLTSIVGLSLWGKTKDYEIDICCFSANHTALRTKRKDLVTRNQDNVPEWGDMYICRLLFQ